MKIISLKKGDKVVESLTKIVSKEDIKSGLLVGLGALTEAQLMVYDLGTKSYSSKNLSGTLEVGNFTSIIAKDPQGQAHIHPHITLCDKDFNTYCGHLKEGIVGATLEIVIFESTQDIKRYEDSEIGLNLIK